MQAAASRRLRTPMTSSKHLPVLVAVLVHLGGIRFAVSQATLPPTLPPTLPTPTLAPVTAAPVTLSPTPNPSATPVTVSPTFESSPITAAPSPSPTGLPSQQPTTSHPTPMPSSSPTPVPTLTPSKRPSRPPTCDLRDKFGVQMIYRGDPYKKDWDSGSWCEQDRTLSSPASTRDPNDDQLEVRGSGEVAIVNGKATLSKSPTLYIEHFGASSNRGWSDVEFTGYAKMLQDDNPRANTGINMLVRTNHGLVLTGEGCDASLYWAHLNYETGKASFTKEYFHDATAVVRSSKVSFDIDEFSSGLPIGKWIGVKFAVFNTGADGDFVRLELYIDTSGGDNEWVQVAAHIDRPGQWLATKPIPSTCNHNDGDTFLGPSRYCALFNVGSSDSTQVIWKDVSIRNIIPQPLNDICSESPSSSPSGIPSTAPTSLPSLLPSNEPSSWPQATPSAAPSTQSSSIPTSSPSAITTTTVEDILSPSLYPSNSATIYDSQAPSLHERQAPSALPSVPPTVEPSTRPSMQEPLSLNATVYLVLPGINQEMDANDTIPIFEDVAKTFLQERIVDSNVVIVSVDVLSQAVATMSGSAGATKPGARKLQLRRVQSISPQQLFVELLVRAETRRPTPSISFAAAVNAIYESEPETFRGELSGAAPLFLVKDPPLDDRGVDNGEGPNASKGGGKNVGAIVSGVIIPILLILAILGAALYYRRRNEQSGIQEVISYRSNDDSSSVASLSCVMGSSPLKNNISAAGSLSVSPESIVATEEENIILGGLPNMFDIGAEQPTTVASPGELLSAPSLSVSPESNLSPPSTGSEISGTSDFSNLYAQPAQEPDDLILPSSVAHQLYPIISASESGESTKDKFPGGDDDDDDDDDHLSIHSSEERMIEQKKALEMLVETPTGNSPRAEDDEVSFASNVADLKGKDEPQSRPSPMRAVFSCFTPPIDAADPAAVQSSIMSVKSSASSRFSPSPQSGQQRQIYEVRSAPGPLGMVVVTSREGPKVYHIKEDSPLKGILEEGDIILSIDNTDTRQMTATALRRFLRTRDASCERILQVLGAKRDNDASD